ncbi:MAG: GNAT family N-acetyltransferase [Planctomycetia bacterium]|nr:GNAT family N-acetyltransferase [Planctomycetia bacterium]
MIAVATTVEHPGWLALRRALWPDTSDAAHRTEMAALVADPSRSRSWVVSDDASRPIGFAEASFRVEPVIGVETTPVVFLEGLYVVPSCRRSGVAHRLLEAVTAWARATGCRALASDVELDNALGHAAHRAMGFQETERVVFYRRDLP